MIIHVDMSNKYNQKTYSVVACVSTDSKHKCDHKFRKGFIVEDPFRRELLNNFSQVELHATLVNLLINKHKNINELVICSDVNPIGKVINHIHKIKNNKISKFSSIEELKVNNVKSAADAFANNIKRNFPKKRNIHRTKSYFNDGTVIVIKENSKEHNYILKHLNKLKKK